MKLHSDVGSGLYIHVPFCHSKCYYCDFYSKPRATEETYDRYMRAVLAELRMRYPELPRWNTIYIGGGTPSILPPDVLRRLVAGVGECSGEFTIEANPEDVTPRWMEQLRTLGINRVSMGVQSFSDSELAAVGRRHDSATALKATKLLAESGLDYSIDLIYGLPGQSVADWRRNLDTLAAFSPGHFSAYLLSYEPGTRLHAMMMKGSVTEADESTASEMYDVLCDFARDHGYVHYEISNFALPDKEASHNSSYWDGTPYVGLGPGAHSYEDGRRGYNPPNLKSYLLEIENGRRPLVIEEETGDERLNDLIITSLRTLGGLSPARLAAFGSSTLGQLMPQIERLMAAGSLELNAAGNYIIPETNWLKADDIMRRLILV